MSKIPDMVFFLDESVLETIGIKIDSQKQQWHPAIELMLDITSENIERNGKGTQKICFTTQQILNWAKSEDWARKMENVGAPFVYPVENPNESNYKSEELVIAANDMHHEIIPDVYVVSAENGDGDFIESFIERKGYEIEHISVDEAIELGEESNLDIAYQR